METPREDRDIIRARLKVAGRWPGNGEVKKRIAGGTKVEISAAGGVRNVRRRHLALHLVGHGNAAD